MSTIQEGSVVTFEDDEKYILDLIVPMDGREYLIFTRNNESEDEPLAMIIGEEVEEDGGKAIQIVKDAETIVRIQEFITTHPEQFPSE